jgi:hypothetical protein
MLQAGDKGIQIPQACPNCKGPLIFLSIRMDTFPYQHTDLGLGCPSCNDRWLFGLPISREAGLSLFILDYDLVKARDAFSMKEGVKCPFHGVFMRPTKYFGSMLSISKHRVQFKCPICFLTRHFDAETGDEYWGSWGKTLDAVKQEEPLNDSAP